MFDNISINGTGAILKHVPTDFQKLNNSLVLSYQS